MFWVWFSAHGFHLAVDARGGRVARFVLSRRTVNLVKLRVIAIASECIFDNV